MISLFPANVILSFCQKREDDLLPKNTLKDDISGIIEKMIFILEDMVFLLIEKLKIIITFTESNTHREN